MSKNVMRAFNTPKKDDGVRNVFDLSQRHIFSAKAGQIIPVACVDTVPGDKFELDLVNIARTMPLNTAAFTRMKQSFDWVFVPYRALWSRFNEFIAQRNDPRSALYGTTSMDNPNMTPCYVPNISLNRIREILYENVNETDIMGFSKMYEGYRLMDMLGYGDFLHRSSPEDTSVHVNLWRALAYQKACCQFYRDSVHDPLEDAFAFNVDDVQGTSVANSDLYTVRGTSVENIKKMVDIFSLRYRPWKKDIVTGTMPTMQYGAVSAVPLSADLSGTLVTGDADYPSTYDISNRSYIYNMESPQADFAGLRKGTLMIGNPTSDSQRDLYAHSESPDNNWWFAQMRTKHTHSGTVNLGGEGQTLFDIIQLRKAEAIQKWKERTLRAGFHTDKQFEAHYGVSADEDGKWCADFIGSVDSYINIDEVLTTANNNAVEGGTDVNNSVGDIAGKGVGVTNGGKLHFETNQFGVLMCLWSCTPEADYSSYGLDQNNTLIERFDYFTSEFENLGLQAVPQSIYNMFPGSVAQVIGYGPRYWNYKTALDKVHGEFNYLRDGETSGSLYDWATPRRDLTQDTNLPTIGAYYINPRILDSIFAVACDNTQKTDQFLVNVMLDIKAIRGMSVIGLPY